MDYILSQVGLVRTVLLIGGTVLMIIAAHVLSFREAIAGKTLDWKAKPIRSLISVGVSHQIAYTKKVPFMLLALISSAFLVVYV
jgi:hypothetical protein